MRGYFGIGIECCKTSMNYGSLYRTAQLLQANFLFIIGKRFRKQCSDTLKSWRHIPVFQYADFSEFYRNLPYDCRLVGVELDNRAIPLEQYSHPQRACYLLGAEDYGLTSEAMQNCHEFVKLRGEQSMNVAVAGSIVLYHRAIQMSPLGYVECATSTANAC
jgi:tRNA G18 (ribose-2'-O)-methylase SpoU